jgi:hypothetical protein
LIGKRLLVVGVIAMAMLTMSIPAAHARYDGPTRVDSWASYGDHVEGVHRQVGPLRVWAPVGSVRHVIWTVANLGGHKPDLLYVIFQACGNDNGFRFHYVATSGRDVSGRVRHDGYVAHDVGPGHDARVHIWIRSRQPNRAYTCLLTGTGNGPSDAMNLRVHS